MKSFARIVATAAVAVVAISGAALAWSRAQGAPAAPAAAKQEGKAEAKAEVVVPFIGNATCPMQAGKPVNKSKFVEHEGQRVYYCCGKCAAAAKADPKAAVAAAYKESKAVANKSCPVSGHAIEAGKSKSVSFMGHTIELCCADCEAGFKKNAYAMTIAAVYGVEDAKNAHCPVMDKEEVNGEDFVIYKGKLVHLCCGDCSEEFKKDADKFLAKATGK